MKPYVWKEGMTEKEMREGAYWERNMLALLLANVLNVWPGDDGNGWYYDSDNNWDGWKRVISIDNGRITFHVPDDFDLGDLPEIEPNWDGHTTEEKWLRIMKECGCKIDEG